MKTCLMIAPMLMLASCALATDVDTIPKKTIAHKRELLFEDNFKGETHDKRWHDVVETFAFEKGALKGTQTRDRDVVGADGKVTSTPHAAVFGLELPTKDTVVQCKIRFAGASVIDVEFDDRQYTGSHYGHLCRAQVRLDKVVIVDERDGSQSNQLIELRKDSAANKDAINQLLASHSASFPVSLQAGKWYKLVVETIGQEMRVTIDGKPSGYLKSPGIGHETKSKLEFGVGGKDGYFTDLKVWNAEPVK